MDRLVTRLDLGASLLELGRTQEGSAMLDEIGVERHEKDPLLLRVGHALARAMAAAQEGEVAAVQRHIAVARELQKVSGMLDPDFARMAVLVGQWCADLGATGTAALACSFAADHYRGMGRDDLAAELESRE